MSMDREEEDRGFGSTVAGAFTGFPRRVVNAAETVASFTTGPAVNTIGGFFGRRPGLVDNWSAMLQGLAPTPEGMEAQYGVNPDEVRTGTTTTTVPPSTTSTTMPPRTGGTAESGDTAAEAMETLGGSSGQGFTVGVTPSGIDRWAIPENYIPPPRVVRNEDRQYVYTGKNLVDSRGQFEFDPITGKARERYDIENDWFMEIANKLGGLQNRKAFFTELYNRGLYGGSKPSPNFWHPDIEGKIIRNFMYAGNVEGRTWDVVAMQLLSQVPADPKRVISRRDINRYLQSAAQQTMGRNLRPKELDQVAASAQSAYAGGATAAQAAAGAVQEKYRPEEDAFKFSQYADLLTRLMR